MVKKNTDDKRKETRGVTRRQFLTTVSAGTVAAAALSAGLGPKKTEGAEEMKPEEMVKILLRVNGRRRRVLVEPRWSLLFVLREKFGLTGTKVGCDRGECGACTVLMDDVPRYACMTLAVEAEGREITTVEGLMKGRRLGEVQQAFAEHDAFQCGYCTPGQVMAVEGLLRSNPHPSPDEIREGVSGNLCRCGTYVNIFRAAGRAAELKAGGGKKS